MHPTDLVPMGRHGGVVNNVLNKKSWVQSPRGASLGYLPPSKDMLSGKLDILNRPVDS